MRKTFLLIATIILAAMAAAADQTPINRKAPDFSLRGQYDNTVTLHSFFGRPLILVACGWKGSEENGPGKTAILEKYGGRIQCMGVADLRTAFSFLSGFIKKKFQKESAPVLLDWKGEVFTSYGLAPDIPNIDVINGQGYVRYFYSGIATPEAVGLLSSSVETCWRKVSNHSRPVTS